MSNNLDTLMDLDPLQLTKEDLSQIVAFHRQKRAEREAGKGRAARKDSGPGISLSQLVVGMTGGEKKAPTLKRRV